MSPSSGCVSSSNSTDGWGRGARAQLHAASERLQGEQGLSEHIAGIPIKGMLLRRQQRFPFQWEATYFVVSWGLALLFASEDFSAAPLKMLRLTGEQVAFKPLPASQVELVAGGEGLLPYHVRTDSYRLLTTVLLNTFRRWAGRRSPSASSPR